MGDNDHSSFLCGKASDDPEHFTGELRVQGRAERLLITRSISPVSSGSRVDVGSSKQRISGRRARALV